MSTYLARTLAAVALFSLAAGCGGGGASSSADQGSPARDGNAERAIAEADIIQLDGGRLYTMSRAGVVSVVDVSEARRLTLLGQTTLAGHPFEMYRRGDFLVTLTNGAVAPDGAARQPTSQRPTPDPGAGAAVIVLDVRDPARPKTVAGFKVPGELADSRIVGDVLYLATYEDTTCYGCGPVPRTMVTSFDVTRPMALRPVARVSFDGNAPDADNQWGGRWKRSIFVTDQRLYIAGHADLDARAANAAGAQEGIIDVLDISDRTGRLVIGDRVLVAGAILSRWQLDERAGVLRVVSQRGTGRAGFGLAAPEVETFAIETTRTLVPLGRMTMRLPRPEGLRAVRFDGARAYAITYQQTDPLFIIDLSDPAHPAQRGELAMPGFMFHLEPHGDRVIGLGVDSTDPGGSLNVSLFDVSDAQAPRMLQRVAFASPRIASDFAILDGELSEDQDRIGKAFRVFPDGLVVAPFSALRSYSQPSTCTNAGGGVQLVQWSGDTLTKRALLPLPGNPRRAFENGGELLAVSDSHVRAFSLASTDAAAPTAEVVIGTCVPSNVYANRAIDDDDLGRACSMGPGHGRVSPVMPLALAALGLVCVARRKRRARPR